MIAAVKSPVLSCAILLALLLNALNAVYANSATWSVSPTSGDWNTAANWMPPTVPNGPSDTATFVSSGVTDISISGLLQLDGIVFDVGADAFTITNKPSRGLTISGAGITNKSGVLQNFLNQEGPRGAGQLYSQMARRLETWSFTLIRRWTTAERRSLRSFNSRIVLRPVVLNSSTWPAVVLPARA